MLGPAWPEPRHPRPHDRPEQGRSSSTFSRLGLCRCLIWCSSTNFAYSPHLVLDTPLQTHAAVHDAAIGEDRGCGEIAGAVAGEKADHSGDLLRASHAPQRYGLVELGELRCIVHCPDID